jgi:hypothetical protein
MACFWVDFSFSAFSEEGATIIYGPFNIFWCKKGAYCYWPIKYMLQGKPQYIKFTSII